MKVTDEMVDRFLSWKLPEDFHPDAGITFTPEFNVEYNAKRGKPPQRHEPIGTNLFTATQARAMLEHVLSGAVSEKKACYWLIERGSPAEWWAGTETPQHWTRDVSKVHPMLKFDAPEKAQGEADRIKYWPTVFGSELRVVEHIDCAGPNLATPSAGATMFDAALAERLTKIMDDCEAGNWFSIRGQIHSLRNDLCRLPKPVAQSATVRRPPHHREVVIETFRALPENWDSYGAGRFNSETVDLALRISKLLEDDWKVVPCADGPSVWLFRGDEEEIIEVRATKNPADRGATKT